MKITNNSTFWKPEVNITFDFPVLMWFVQPWICKKLKVAQMEFEIKNNIIYLN